MITYNFTEACNKLNAGASTLSGLATKGIIPGAKIGQEWVFDEVDLKSFLRAEIERQTLERIECFNRGEKPRVATGSRRTIKPNLDKL